MTETIPLAEAIVENARRDQALKILDSLEFARQSGIQFVIRRGPGRPFVEARGKGVCRPTLMDSLAHLLAELDADGAPDADNLPASALKQIAADLERLVLGTPHSEAWAASADMALKAVRLAIVQAGS